MADDTLRQLQRRFSETGSDADKAALLSKRLRVGELDEARVHLAALLGDPACQTALGVAPDPDQPLVDWLASLQPAGGVAALRRARDAFSFGPELVAALPIAAGDGTLKKRIDAAPGRVRAKTGLLDGVTGLSGYADGPAGPLVFSILSNGHTRGDAAAMDAMDAFAAALVAP